MEATPTPSPVPAARTPSILLDTALLVGLRVVYFLLSRRYLLYTLSPTLRDLQRPDTLLPQPVTRQRSTSVASSSSRTGPRAPDPGAVPLLSETEDTDASPSSSYPSSPRVAMTRVPSEPIEMDLLGAKLSNVPRAPRVLELTHGQASAAAKSTKRTARGLGRMARVLFSLSFAESMNLLTLVVFQMLGVLHANARQFNFSMSLHIILGLVLLVMPLAQCLLFTYRSKESPTAVSTKSSKLSPQYRLLIALLPYALYIFLFTRIPPFITAVPIPPPSQTPSPTDAPDAAPSDGTLENAIVQWSTSGPEGWEQGGWLASSLGRVVVLGVLVIAGLSGIGAVVTAWDYLRQAAGARRVVSDRDVLEAERSLYRVRHEIVSKREELERLMPTQGGSGWMGRVFGTKADQEISGLQAELGGLQQMEADIARQVGAMKKRHAQQGFQHTLKGSIYNVLGYVFAVYCAARLVMCLVSLFVAPLATSHYSAEGAKGNTNGDWISFVLAKGLAHFDSDADVASWARAISLLLTGLLVASSLTMVLRWLGRVLKLTSRTVGSGFLLLTLGQLFATYVISLLVQLRTSLPAQNEQTKDDSLLRSLPDFRIFGRLFDAVFLCAALATAVYRYIALKVGGDEVEFVSSVAR